MIDKIKNLFALKSNPADSGHNAGNDVQSSVGAQNAEEIQTGETYVQYGARLCGHAYGNIESLTPYLQKVYASESNHFALHTTFQENHKLEVRNKITSQETLLEQENNNLEQIKTEITSFEKEVADAESEISRLKAHGDHENKEASVKMYLGFGILLLLTIYLFVFYSSTFYSAFFKDFMDANNEIGIGTAMFDPTAISNALATGIGELVFICTAPIIFMALGYSLHFFNAQKDWGKYIKAGGCIVITFVFDCILAYLIGKKIYDVEIMSILAEMPPYNLKEAIGDPNIWAVIFCGFITYMIWGIVLDMTLSAYNELKFNKEAIIQQENIIEQAKSKIQKAQTEATELQNKIAGIKGEIAKLQLELTKVYIPRHEIKRALTDFFAGWTRVANVLQPANYNQANAQTKFDNFLQNIQ